MTKFMNIFSLIVYSVLCVFPLAFAYQKMIYLLISFVLWYITAIMIDGRFFKSSIKLIVFIGIIIAMDYVVALTQGKAEEVTLGLNKTPTFICFAFFLFYKDRIPILKIYTPLMFFLIGIGCATTISGNLLFPGASRLLTNTFDYYEIERSLFRSIGIGGYDFVFMCVFLVLPLIQFLKQKNNTIISIMILLIIALCLSTVVVGAFMTGIIICILSILLCFIDIHKLKLLRLFIVIMIGMFSFEPLMEFLVYLGNVFDIEALQKHSEELLSNSYVENDEDNNRLLITFNAISNWLQSPLLGQMWGKASNLKYSGHSELFGFLEKYGVLSYVYYFYLYKVYKKVLNTLNSIEQKAYFKALFMLIIIFMAIDRFDNFYALGFAFFFFIPMLFVLLDQKYYGIQKGCVSPAIVRNFNINSI